ncbi:MAG: UDP-2,3-diacylglucosamine diphosphatase LpxI [Rickettsiales bacterium]
MQTQLAQTEAPSTAPIGLIAGKGSLPLHVLSACREKGRPVFILALTDTTPVSHVQHVDHAWVRLGEVGKAISLLRERDIKEVVIAGKIERPSITSLRPDAKGMLLLSKLGGSLLAGDDALLSTIVRFFEGEGFTITGADDVIKSLLVPVGVLGKYAPDKTADADIKKGVDVARAIGALDIGQAVIVQQGHVLGVEAVEGTDALIARAAGLKQADSGGVLVKVKKPGQERRVDLPAIGLMTVKAVAHAGFAGIAIEAGGALMLDREAAIAEADALGIFVVGIGLNSST